MSIILVGRRDPLGRPKYTQESNIEIVLEMGFV
jgi:hypothetical protein